MLYSWWVIKFFLYIEKSIIVKLNPIIITKEDGKVWYTDIFLVIFGH